VIGASFHFLEVRVYVSAVRLHDSLIIRLKTDLFTEQYAITEASYLIVRILQTFEDISWEGKAGKPVKGLGLTLWPADGTTVRLKFANRYQKSCVELN
jgi:hypothetical protein